MKSDDRRSTSSTLRLTLLILGVSCLAAAQTKTDLRYTVAPGASVTITSDYGPIVVHSVGGNQLVVSATPHSEKVKVETNSSPAARRFDFVTHVEQKGTPEETRVDYDVQLPAGTSLLVHAGGGPVNIQGVNGDVTVDADRGAVEVRDAANCHVHLRTVSGAITLANITNGHVEVTSVSGTISLTNVSGSLVTANTTSSAITFTGDAAGGGAYSLSSHNGPITVALPATASVEVTARSVTGSVQDDFRLDPASHPSIAVVPGKSFAGRANAGASSLHLRTFSGKITVKKQ